MTIPEAVKELRKSKAISQEGLARLLDVTKSSVSGWEQGAHLPDSRHLVKMAALCHGKLSEFFAMQAGAGHFIARRRGVFTKEEPWWENPARWHEMLEKILASGNATAIEAVQTNLLAFVKLVEVEGKRAAPAVSKQKRA